MIESNYPTKIMADNTPLPNPEKTSQWNKDAPAEEQSNTCSREPIDSILSKCKNPAEAVTALQAAGYTHSEVNEFIKSIDDETFDSMLAEDDSPEPPWLACFEPDTQLEHNGWQCRVLTAQKVPDGRTLVLIEPLCTTPEARAKYRAHLKRRGFSEKKVQRMLRETFPAEVE